MNEDFAVVEASGGLSSGVSAKQSTASDTAEIFEAIKQAASLAPPPVSNIYWFAVNIGALL